MSVREHEEPAMTAMIYQGELDFISRCILDYPDLETGGELFGYWTDAGVPVVLFAIGPGPKANHSPAFFNQDFDYLVSVGDLLVSRYGLQHIGEWHSHHKLGLDRPSGHDAETMFHGLRNLSRVLLAVGNLSDGVSSLNAFNFARATGQGYVQAAWDVKAGESPFRRTIESDAELEEMLTNPLTEQASMADLKTVGASVGYRLPAFAADYWLKDKANHLALKEIVDAMSSESVDGRCRVLLDAAGFVHLLLDTRKGEVTVSFQRSFPFQPPTVRCGGRGVWKDGLAWNDETLDVVQEFLTYYRELMKGDEDDAVEVSGGAGGAESVSGTEPVQVSGDGNATGSCGDGGADEPKERLYALHGNQELSGGHAEGLCDENVAGPAGQSAGQPQR